MRLALLATAALLAAVTAPIALAQQSNGEDRRARITAEREAALAKRLAGYTRAESRSCMPMRPQQDMQKIAGTAVVYGRGRTLWVNRLGSNCTGLREDTIMITQTPLGQFCRGDIVTLIDNASTAPRGACAFGDFERYERR